MYYKNPVISLIGKDHGDPAVLKYNGTYYLYHTGYTEIPVYQSTNLIDWEKIGVALHAVDEPNHWAQIELWAPEVIYENGVFYMYVAASVKKKDGRANDTIRRIGVATSDNPLGPFKLEDQPLTDEWSIDAHPFKDDDGSYYMFYNVRNKYTLGPNDVIGTGNVVDRMIDLKTLSGKPTMVVKPEFPWEGSKGQNFFWNEGPFVLKHNQQYYQMYSAGFFGDDTYGMYYATSGTPMGTDGMDDKSWKKWNGAKPILQSNGACLGPGHHVVVKGPNGVDDYIVYHGYENDGKTRGRKVRIGRLWFEDEKLVVEQPTLDKLPVPKPPIIDGRLIGSTEELNKRMKDISFNKFHFETNFCLSSIQGVISGTLQFERAGQSLTWKVIPKTGELKINFDEGDINISSKHLTSLNFSVYQNLIMERDKDILAIYVNQVKIHTMKIPVDRIVPQLNDGDYAGTIVTAN